MQHLGQIEWKRPVTVQYTITNTGDEPLVLSEVEPFRGGTRLCLYGRPLDKDSHCAWR